MKDWVSQHWFGFWTAAYACGTLALFLLCQAMCEGGMFGLGWEEAIVCGAIALVLYRNWALPTIKRAQSHQ